MKPLASNRSAVLTGWALLIFSAILFVLLTSLDALQVSSPTSGQSTAPHILIDPGHGGADGGACAPDGSLEKDYNLSISLALRDMLRLCGYEVTLTRETDMSIHDETAVTIREQKVSDMHNRLALYDAADLVISIHQNQFPQRSCKGTQFFYAANNPASCPLGTVMRDTLYRLLQPDNTRELKVGTSDIYLLHETSAPAVLAECGFLSNPEERALLQTPEYQQKLAFSLTCGVLTYAP
ncbi:MAG: N-acetylmuramoyl-L-alanine amidase [Clostridia bacterium]|nr:N-acetylmuramoyl-L-alanine amidase [Clostridia bacterium]